MATLYVIYFVNMMVTKRILTDYYFSFGIKDSRVIMNLNFIAIVYVIYFLNFMITGRILTDLIYYASYQRPLYHVLDGPESEILDPDDRISCQTGSRHSLDIFHTPHHRRCCSNS